MPTFHESTAEADAALIARISSGDEAAFRTLYERFSRPLYSLIFKIVQDAQDAEDVLQLTCVQVWKKAASFEPGRASVFTWLVIIARSKAIDRIRQRQRHVRLAEEQALENQVTQDGVALVGAQPAAAATGSGESATDGVDLAERREAIRRALEKIPDEQRLAIELAFFKGLTQSEISDSLGTPLGTIKARIRRGMLRLRDNLEGRL